MRTFHAKLKRAIYTRSRYATDHVMTRVGHLVFPAPLHELHLSVISGLSEAIES